MKYPECMDVECIKICDAINALPGIRTSESCCGHDERPFRVFFSVDEIKQLRPILMASHSSAWDVKVRWANGDDQIYFMLEGPVGKPDMPGGADDFASWL